jgi:hypothetical protein
LLRFAGGIGGIWLGIIETLILSVRSTLGAKETSPPTIGIDHWRANSGI